MLGRIVLSKGSKDEAEKPFWISFSDLMTALMVLFLVVMAISLLSVTQKLRDVQMEEAERADAIDRIVSSLQEAAAKHGDVSVTGSRDRVVIEFGEAARFASNDHRIGTPGAERLRRFAPEILAMAESEDGRRWFKRVVVEGFTDPRGTYLHNLHLSLMRAESVVCNLLAPGGAELTDAQKQAVRRLFLVGGFSSNSTRTTDEESRRVELRLDFRTVREKPEAPALLDVPLGQCRI